MATREAKIKVTVDDKDSAKLGAVAAKGQSAAGVLSKAFTQAGQLIGGEVGEVVNRLSESFEGVERHGPKLAVVGAALAGVGAVLTGLGSKEQAATQQLNAAIDATGHSAEDFDGQVESAVKHLETFGYTATETKPALQTLVSATRDPAKALAMMGEVADLAAARHINLAQAADQVARVISGRGQRTLALYGITVQKNADGTKDYAGANEKLAAILNGQAAAAADTWTGKLHHIEAAVEDNVSAFGQKWGPTILAAGVLLPVVGKAASGASSLIGKLGGAFKTSAVEAEAAGASIVETDTEIVAANEAAAASATGAAGSKGIGGLASSLRGGAGLAGALGVAALGMAAFSAVQDEEAQRAAYLRQLTEDYTQALEESNGAIDENIRQVAAKHLADAGALDDATKLRLGLSEVTDAATGNSVSMADVTKKLDQISAHTKSFLDPTIALRGALGDENDALKAGQQRLAESQAATNKVSGAWSNAATSGSKLADVVSDMSNKFSALNDKTINAEKANISFLDSIDSVTAAEKQNGKSLSDNTAAGRANRSAILDSITAAQSHAEAVLKQTGSADQATAAFKRDIAALDTHAGKVFGDRDAVDALVRKYGQLPTFKLTTVDLRNRAAAKLQRIEDGLHALTDEPWTVTINAQGELDYQVRGKNGGQIRFNAAGTDYSPGGRTIVAERETEIINLPRGSTVTPASRWRGGSSGNVTFAPVITLPHVSAAPPQELARQIVSALEQFIGSGGTMRILKGIR